MSDKRFIQISSSFNGYTFCAHTQGVYSRISQFTKFVLGERKWKPIVKKFCARLRWFLELYIHSYRSIYKRIYRIKFAFFKFPWNLSPAWEETAKYTKRNCNNRRMLCEVGEPLFVIRHLTLRPLIEDISDKSQTLEGVTLEQKTPYLICIWTLQGSLVDLTIYIFEFVRCSEKKWEVGETCAASRGIFIFQFSSLFHTCYCNAPAIFKYSVPKQQTTTAAILSVISGNESN